MNTTELLNAISAVLPFVSNRDIIEQYSAIHLYPDGIEATDGYNGIFYPLEFGKNVDSLVPADLFYKLVKSVRAKEVTLKCTKDTISVLTKKMVGEINCIQENQDRMVFNIGKKHKLPDNFIECLKICRFGASSDQSLGCLVGVIVINDSVYGIDSHSVVKAKLNSSIKTKLAIPIPLVNEMIKYANVIQYYDINVTSDGVQQLIFVLKNGVKIFGNLLEVKLKKDIEVTLSAGITGKPLRIGILPDAVLVALDRHLIIQQDLSEIDKRVALQFSGNIIRLRSQTEKGKIIEKIKLDSAIKRPTSFVLNPLLLKDFLPHKPKLVFYEKSIMIQFIGNIFEYFLVGEEEVK